MANADRLSVAVTGVRETRHVKAFIGMTVEVTVVASTIKHTNARRQLHERQGGGIRRPQRFPRGLRKPQKVRRSSYPSVSEGGLAANRCLKKRSGALRKSRVIEKCLVSS